VNELSPTGLECIARIQEILVTARNRALQSVNAAMVAAYWEIGREIVEEQQRGAARAKYGDRLLRHLSAQLTAKVGKGFSVETLRKIRQFYLAYRDRPPEIQYTPWTESRPSPSRPLRTDLAWSHYRQLMRVHPAARRDFYEVECAKSRWSARELDRQIASLLFERLARSRNKEGILALAREGQEIQKPTDLVKDPYILEFTGLPEAAEWQESDLEQALMDRLQQFLLELGRDLFFAARQRRITIDGDHFYVDLVFYHRVLRCFLLIDLKVGRLTQQDIGQMLLYTGYFEQEEMREDENPPIGLILCTAKNEAMIKYTLSRDSTQLFTSRYQLHLPSEEELVAELRREMEQLKRQDIGGQEE